MAGLLVAAVGYLPPLAGALFQEAIDMAVILNALRALGPGTLEAWSSAPPVSTTPLPSRA